MTQTLDDYESRFGDGLAFSQAFVKKPRAFLQRAACFKFATKMLGETGPVLNLDASDGFGAWILARECGACHAVVDDNEARFKAEATWRGDGISFGGSAALATRDQIWPALVWLTGDVPEDAFTRFERLLPKLAPMATVLIGWGLEAPDAVAYQDQAAVLKPRFKKCFTFFVSGAVIRPASPAAQGPLLFLGAGINNR
ncbi:hypothetical protein [Acanthopleuribacter pedis]|uniref:Uncharacterized protein n=1 Tax=Acanthopleuribacter pedis TaxID=442870 RepID=A0A8J7U487_9BACT|nr:hypothetical protein [Acanthopleuribacter pedis]MBO1318021.1 hypothetical protein [Acanthopleuribacter pedis]